MSNIFVIPIFEKHVALVFCLLLADILGRLLWELCSEFAIFSCEMSLGTDFILCYMVFKFRQAQ